MARKAPSDWPLAPRPYRPNLQEGFEFESKKRAAFQDRKRARILRASKLAEKRKIARLIARLEGPEPPPCCITSQRYLRAMRRVINGQLHRLMQGEQRPMVLFTLIPDGWLVSADKQDTVDPDKLMQQIRGALLRAGVSDVDGWAFCALDLEYIEHRDAYSFHVHGIAAGGVIEKIDSLRYKPKFKAEPGDDDLGKHRVRLDPIVPGTEANAANYLIKTYFGSAVFGEKANGKRFRTGKRVAIPYERNAELLAWLSWWKIDNFLLLSGLYFGKDGLKAKR